MSTDSKFANAKIHFSDDLSIVTLVHNLKAMKEWTAYISSDNNYTFDQGKGLYTSVTLHD